MWLYQVPRWHLFLSCISIKHFISNFVLFSFLNLQLRMLFWRPFWTLIEPIPMAFDKICLISMSSDFKDQTTDQNFVSPRSGLMHHFPLPDDDLWYLNPLYSNFVLWAIFLKGIQSSFIWFGLISNLNSNCGQLWVSWVPTWSKMIKTF